MAKWTLDKIKEEAKQYTYVKDFRKNSKSAYNKASRLGILEDICGNMIKIRRGKYSIYEIMDEAIKYSARSEFESGSQKAYNAALRYGIIDHVCIHMESKKNPQWNKTNIGGEALKYDTRKEFATKSKWAYQNALKLGIIDDVCEHMQTGKIPSDNDCLYVWKIQNTNIYKIGITSQKLGYERIKRVANFHNVEAEIVAYTKVNDAYSMERFLHKEYQTPQSLITDGDGYSEFKTLTDDELSRVLDYLKKNMAEGVLNYPHRLKL